MTGKAGGLIVVLLAGMPGGAWAAPIAHDGNIDIAAVAHDKRAPGYFNGRAK